MGVSPAVSPRLNAPGMKPAPTASKAKALAILNYNRNVPSPTAPSAATTPGDGEQDLAEQMNDEVRQQFVSGMRSFNATSIHTITNICNQAPASAKELTLSYTAATSATTLLNSSPSRR